MKQCKKGMCALGLIYPNGDNATYACDEECHFKYCDAENKEYYTKEFPAEMIKCGLIKM